MKDNDNTISLNKYISSTGKCSRREADEYIRAGKVTINGKLAELGNRVFDGDHVKLNRKLLHSSKSSHKLYIVFNKPKGIVCTTDLREPDNIISYIGHKKRLFPIGRLDKLSQGLIFLTNDGDIVNKILRVGNAHEKEYIVVVNKPITEAFILKMSTGVPILGTKTEPCPVTQIDEKTFRIILTQGLNRQIRRMVEYLGFKAKKLKRTRIMNVKTGKLKEGDWRTLTYEEMKSINKSITESKNIEQTSKPKKRVNQGSKPKFNFENKKSNASRRKKKSPVKPMAKKQYGKSSYKSYKKKRK